MGGGVKLTSRLKRLLDDVLSVLIARSLRPGVMKSTCS
jgi:hypothetical protein